MVVGRSWWKKRNANKRVKTFSYKMNMVSGYNMVTIVDEYCIIQLKFLKIVKLNVHTHTEKGKYVS